jgi:hypothetical protein
MIKNLTRYFTAIILCSCLSLNSSSQIYRLIDIPPRSQWNNADGYCGEMSIQMIGLYYGNYISEDIVRTVAGGELLVGVNDEAAVDSFRFNHDEWDYNNEPNPQYKNYLVWLKQHLYYNHPVIICVYIQGLNDPDYDHIIPAIGFSSPDTINYNTSDSLIFNDCFDSTYFTRSFGSIWDTRSMNGNGATYEYCIPKSTDYGCAVTGNMDSLHVTLPVNLAIDQWDEPNVTLGDSPVMFHAIATASGLSVDSQYALLRYNTFTHLPTANFDPLTADETFYFTATAATETYVDSFMSHTATFYRCIPYTRATTTTGISNQTVVNNISLSVYPNPANPNSKIYFTLPASQNVSIKLYDICGKEVSVIASEVMSYGSHILPLYSKQLAPGTYICNLTTEKEFRSVKIVITGQ